MKRKLYTRTDKNGNKYYYADKERKILHRKNGPAVEYINGEVVFAQNGCVKGAFKRIFDVNEALTSVGNHIDFLAKNFFEDLLRQYPDRSPREMASICSSQFNLVVARYIVKWRYGYD